MHSNEVEYSTPTGPYCKTNDAKEPFFMPEFSSSKRISHQFYVDNNEGELEIGYEMITGRDLMVQLGLSDNFKCQVLQRDGATLPMKEPSGPPGKTDLTSCNICEVAMQTAEPFYTR